MHSNGVVSCDLQATHEWQDGVLARIMRTACKDESPDQKWILFDGPVDTLWIESMNTTLDDNKLLTLLSGTCMETQTLLSGLYTCNMLWRPSVLPRAECNARGVLDYAGERIAMPAAVSLLFEVEDLSQASPATVSRAGMIYLNVEDLGWRPYITSWLAAKTVGAAAGGIASAEAAAGSTGGSGPAAQVAGLLGKLIERYMEAALECRRLHCRQV